MTAAAATKVSLSLQAPKPALPPKPNFLLTDTTSKLTRFTHILNTTKLVSDILNNDHTSQMESAETQVSMSCQQSSQCKQSLFIDGVELNESGDAASLAFNLLDEIYAEIEDKQIKSSLSKQMTLKMLNTPELLNYLNKKQQQQQQLEEEKEAKVAEVATVASPDKHKADECCNSLSCSSSSYTSASSSQSNQCSCTYSSSSVSSTYSTNESDQQQPPPLPTVPPPPLQSAHSSPSMPRSRHNNRVSLTLEEEIELEMKTKLNSFSLNKEAPDEHRDAGLESDERQPEEDEYLEPVLLETEKSYSTDTLNAGDSKESQLNHYAVPYSIDEPVASTALTSTPIKILSSPYRLKSLFRLNSSSRPAENASERIVPNIPTPPATNDDSQLQKTPKKTLNYLFKTSGRITATLRMMRTKSSSHASNTELNVCGDEVDSIDVIGSSNHFTDNMFTLRKNRKAKKTTTVSCQPAATHAVEISGPTLISQTFDLSKQRLVAIQNQQELNMLSCEQAASFSSMSSSTFSSSSFDEHSNNTCSPALPRANKFSLAQSRAASTLSINNISPTIALNTIITNVYEEDGNIWNVYCVLLGLMVMLFILSSPSPTPTPIINIIKLNS